MVNIKQQLGGKKNKRELLESLKMSRLCTIPEEATEVTEVTEEIPEVTEVTEAAEAAEVTSCFVQEFKKQSIINDSKETQTCPIELEMRETYFKEQKTKFVQKRGTIVTDPKERGNIPVSRRNAKLSSAKSRS